VFWLLRVSVTGVLDEVDAGDRNQTGIALLHVLTMTTWESITTPRSRADSTTLAVVVD